jgi:nicotinamide-nucleotide amidase
MIAHILSTGDELLQGQIIDTNSGFLCNGLKEMGIQVQKMTSVGDDVESMASAIQEISVQADLCLVTGGLGPTGDDLTALACSKAAEVRLELDKDALASMHAYFKQKGFQWSRANEKQAMLPVTSTMIANHSGTAPGFYIKINTCLFVFMPGVPSEMKMMFEQEIKALVKQKFGLDQDILIQRFTIFGLPESMVGSKLKGFERKFPYMQLGFRVDFPVIEVKIMVKPSHASFQDRDNTDSDMARAKHWVMEQLGDKVVSACGSSMAREVGDLLTRAGQTLAVAESCTGGLIAHMITNEPGSSDYFLFSGVTYSNAAKINILNVQEETLVKYGAVHEQTAIEMARGARRISGADFAVSTTGIAGPGGGSVDKPVGMVCIGLAGPSVSMARTCQFLLNDRDKNKKIFAATALDLLRRHLISPGETA